VPSSPAKGSSFGNTNSTDCSFCACGEHCKEQPPTIELNDFEMIPNSVGLICNKYVAASQLAGDQATDFGCGNKRKVCTNRECATRRLVQPYKINAKRVSLFIKAASDSMLERLVLNPVGLN